SGNAAGIPNVSNFDGSTVGAALFPLAPKGNPGFATEVQFGDNFRNPYSEQWNLGIQRQISNNMAAEVRYVGNHDIANFQEVNGNPALQPLIDNGFGNLIPAGLSPCTTPGAPGSSDGAGYADCNFSRVIKYANSGYSIYHGLQTQFRIQNFHGFTGQASYTFSKTIDNASEAFSTNAGTVVAIGQNPFDITKAERGLSNYDFPHVFGLLWVYDIPSFHKGGGMLGRLLGGWQINGTYRYSSGQPWTVEQNAGLGLCDPTNFTGGTLDSCRPFPGSAGAPFGSVGQCTDPTFADCGLMSVNTGSPIALNQARFIINDINSEKFFGMPFSPLGRNTERGQPISTANLAVFKNFRIRERLTFQLQAEAFNVFNHQWLGIPIQDVNNASSSQNGIT